MKGRYRVLTTAAGAGTTARPVLSLYSGGATNPIWLRRVYIGNTTATACKYGLYRLTARGTPGSALTEQNFSPLEAANVAECFGLHTADLTPGGQLDIYPVLANTSVQLGWTDLREDRASMKSQGVDDRGLYIPSGTANGIGIILMSGTGQVCDVGFEWIE